METLGSLVDKQSILMIRRACAKDEGAKSIMDRLIGKNRDEINQFYYRVVSGQITDKEMIVQPKFKNYAHQDNSVAKETKLGVTMQNLIEANITLWGIEDDRRDTSKPEAERLKLMDEVSIWNKKRNEAIDQIDEILWEQSPAGKKCPPDKDCSCNGGYLG